MRAHSGTYSECIYSVLSFGIPVNDFPISGTGEMKKTNHLKWIERRRKELYLSSRVSNGIAIDLPARQDVLLGRGNSCNQHWGKKRFHEIIADRYGEYDRCNRSRKTQVSQEVVEYVQNYGARFLKQCNEAGVWIKAGNREARNKVAHGFRRKREFRLNAATHSIPTVLKTNDRNEAEPVKKRRALSFTKEAFFPSFFWRARRQNAGKRASKKRGNSLLEEIQFIA